MAAKRSLLILALLILALLVVPSVLRAEETVTLTKAELTALLQEQAAGVVYQQAHTAAAGAITKLNAAFDSKNAEKAPQVKPKP